jgi:hypothetical protein
VKILFVMLQPGFIRYFETVLRDLAQAGHDVHVAYEITRDKLGENTTARRLVESSPRITCGTTPERVGSVRDLSLRVDRTATRSGDVFQAGHGDTAGAAWESLATSVRLMADYLRYFEPAFVDAHGIRDRAGKRLPQLHQSVIRRLGSSGRVVRTATARVLQAIERAIPTAPGLEPFVREHDPDLLLVTPLIELGSQQVDYIKCARRLGIPSALAVASWDNLTSKGLIRVIPDHVLVWNEAQREEAVALHGVRAERVHVTGAHLFDVWFAMQPSRSREAFCREVGLDPARPFVLYVGSSIFIAPEEVPFAERWLAHLRQSDDAAVSSLGVLFRPHPANSRQWRALDRDSFPNVAVWPPIGTDPNTPGFRPDFFDSLYHCAAVVGVNTSAQLEAGIVGRPVFTVEAPEFAHAQAGTLHFKHLVSHEGGLVRLARSLDEHERQLAETLHGGTSAETARRFVQSFLRPRGLDNAAAPAFVEAVEAIGRLPRPAAEPEPVSRRLSRPAMVLLARVAHALAEDRPLWVYPMRPVVTGAIWVAASGYWLRDDSGEALHNWGKRARRAVRVASHESTIAVSRGVRSIRKSVSKRVLQVGVRVKRVARRGVRL